MKKLSLVFCAVFLLFGIAASANAGKIVLANDEWTLSNTGFVDPNDPAQFATNVAEWFTGGGVGGDFLAYSTNFGLTQSDLRTVMEANYNWTVSTSVAFTVANLLNYDGIFLSGNAADNAVLVDYVNAGGNVYLAGGTGWGGPVAEAARWNPFLNTFGLGFGTYYNGVQGNLAIDSDHAIFKDVDHLYQNNGNSTLDINIADPRATLLVSHGDQGLYAVYDSSTTTDPVPEPATMLLLGTGLIGLAGLKRRKN